MIAGRPAFDADSLPVGPHALCRVLREAAGTFDLNTEHKQHLYRQFDRTVMQFIGPLYEALNTYLIRQRVLPFLTYVPVRAKTRRFAKRRTRREEPCRAHRPR